MKNRPILINAGDPNGVFFEIFFKTLKSQKIKSPIILVCCKKILVKEMKFFSFKKKIKLINKDLLNIIDFNNNYINLIDVRLKTKKKKNSQSKHKYIFGRMF